MRFQLRLPFIARDSTYTTPTTQDRVVAAINEYRRLVGVGTLKRNATLDRVAQRRADLASDYYHANGTLVHDDPAVTGDRFWEILPAEGVGTWVLAGEILAINNFSDPVPGAMEGWKNSPKHEIELREPSYGDLGVGVAWRSPSGVTVLAVVFLDD